MGNEAEGDFPRTNVAASARPVQAGESRGTKNRTPGETRQKQPTGRRPRDRKRETPVKQLPAKDEAESGAPEQDTRKDDSGVFQGGVKSMDKTASSSENTNRKGRGKKLPDKPGGISGTSKSIQGDKQKEAPKALGDGSRDIDIKARSSLTVQAAQPQVLDKFGGLKPSQQDQQEGASRTFDDGGRKTDTMASPSTNPKGGTNGSQAPEKLEAVSETRNLGQGDRQDEVSNAFDDGSRHRDTAASSPAHLKALGKQKSEAKFEAQKSDQGFKSGDDSRAFDDSAPQKGTAASSSPHPRGTPTGKQTRNLEAQKPDPPGRQGDASEAFNDGAEPRDRTVWSSAQPKEAITGKQETEAMPEVQKPNLGDIRKDTSKVFNDGAGSRDPTALSSASLKSTEIGKQTSTKPEATSEAPNPGRRDKQSDISSTYYDGSRQRDIASLPLAYPKGEEAGNQKPEVNSEAQKSYQGSKWKDGSQVSGNGSQQSETAALFSAPRGVPTATQRANLEDQNTSQPGGQEYASQVPNDGAQLRSPPASSPVYSKGGAAEKQGTTKPVALSGSDKANHKDNENQMSNPSNDAGEQGGSRTSSKGAPTETAAIETTSKAQESDPGNGGDDNSQAPNDGAKLRDPTATANPRGKVTGKPVVAGHAVVSHNSNHGDKRNTRKASEGDSEQGAATTSSPSSPKGAATSQTIFEYRKPDRGNPPSQGPINGAGQGGSTASSSSSHPNGAGSGKEISPGTGNGSVKQGGSTVSAAKPGLFNRTDRNGPVVSQIPSKGAKTNFPAVMSSPNPGGTTAKTPPSKKHSVDSGAKKSSQGDNKAKKSSEGDNNAEKSSQGGNKAKKSSQGDNKAKKKWYRRCFIC